MKTNDKILSTTLVPLFSLLLAVCAWITVPAPVPFTMQTFALFLSLYVTGGRRTCAAVCLYLALGLFGLPVFSGGGGGVGVLLGPTGGYMLGWIFAALIMWAGGRLTPKKTYASVALILAGLICIYITGTLWYAVIYARHTGGAGIVSAILLCVVPFVIPDLLKLATAILVSRRLKRALSKSLKF